MSSELTNGTSKRIRFLVFVFSACSLQIFNERFLFLYLFTPFLTPFFCDKWGSPTPGELLSLRFVRFLNRVFGISPGRRCQSSLQKYTRSSSFLRLSSRQIEGLSPPQSGDDSTKSLPHGNYLPTNFIFLTSSSSVPGRLFTYIPIFISSHIYRLSWVSQLLRDPHERMQPQVC